MTRKRTLPDEGEAQRSKISKPCTPTFITALQLNKENKTRDAAICEEVASTSSSALEDFDFNSTADLDDDVLWRLRDPDEEVGILR